MQSNPESAQSDKKVSVQVDPALLDSITTESLSQYLSCLFRPDTEVVKESTRVLKQYFKRVQALENLLILMASSPDQNVRQVSCVYLRKIITNLWLKLPAND